MGMLPWEDWFDHVSQKENDIAELYQTYQKQRDQINYVGHDYSQKLQLLQHIMLDNYALLIILVLSQMSEEDYTKWLVENPAIKQPLPYSSPTLLQITQAITEYIGFSYFTSFVSKGGKALLSPVARATINKVKNAYSTVKGLFSKTSSGSSSSVEDTKAEVLDEPEINNFSSKLDDVGFTQEGATKVERVNSILDKPKNPPTEIPTPQEEAPIPEGEVPTLEGKVPKAAGLLPEEAASGDLAAASASSASMGLLAAGAGVFVFFGIDAIIGAIQGANESKELDQQKQNLKTALDKVQKYLDNLKGKLNDLNTSIKQEKERFLHYAAILDETVVPATYNYEFLSQSMSNDQLFEGQMDMAVQEYGFLSVIRQDWQVMSENSVQEGNPLTWNKFKEIELLKKPSHMDTNTAIKYFDYVQNRLEIKG